MSVRIITKLSLNLPFSWLRRSGIRCLAHTANESGFPVRYIPKKHRDTDQTQNSSSNGLPNPNVRIPNIENQSAEHELTQERFQACEFNQNFVSSDEIQNPNTVKFFGIGDVDYHDGVIDPECLEEAEEVEEMQDYGGSDVQKQGIMKTSRSKKDAEKFAIELLAKRAITAVELRKKLSGRNFPLDVVRVVVHDLRVRGMINDRLYAETFSQSRWSSSSWGPRRIKHALSKKGVSENDVDNAVKLVFNDDRDGDIKSSSRLSDSALEQLYIQACKQWQRSQNVSNETRRARVIRWLQYRGFDWGVVSFILKKLESQHPL